MVDPDLFTDMVDPDLFTDVENLDHFTDEGFHHRSLIGHSPVNKKVTPYT